MGEFKLGCSVCGGSHQRQYCPKISDELEARLQDENTQLKQQLAELRKRNAGARGKVVSDKPKCGVCGIEIHRDSGIAHCGTYVRHGYPSGCTEPLKARITELERELARVNENRATLTKANEEWYEKNAELERQLVEAKQDTVLLDRLEALCQNGKGPVVLDASIGASTLRQAINAQTKGAK